MDAKDVEVAPPPAHRPGKAGRAPEQTREALLRAAIAEFAREGYGGARVDRISRAAGSNDRMLYYYFTSKEELFRVVIERCYADLVAEEEALELDLSQPATALERLIAFNWDYYWRKPELLSILASENLFEGRHIANKIEGTFSNAQLTLLNRILDAGVGAGVFKPECDSFLISMTIMSLTYFYRSNLFTLSTYLNVDLADPARRAGWLRHVQTMVLSLVRRDA